MASSRRAPQRAPRRAGGPGTGGWPGPSSSPRWESAAQAVERAAPPGIGPRHPIAVAARAFPAGVQGATAVGAPVEVHRQRAGHRRSALARAASEWGLILLLLGLGLDGGIDGRLLSGVGPIASAAFAKIHHLVTGRTFRLLDFDRLGQATDLVPLHRFWCAGICGSPRHALAYWGQAVECRGRIELREGTTVAPRDVDAEHPSPSDGNLTKVPTQAPMAHQFQHGPALKALGILRVPCATRRGIAHLVPFAFNCLGVRASRFEAWRAFTPACSRILRHLPPPLSRQDFRTDRRCLLAFPRWILRVRCASHGGRNAPGSTPRRPRLTSPASPKST